MGVGNDPKDLDIVVDNPEKFVKTMESYIAFSVKTKVRHCTTIFGLKVSRMLIS